MIKMIEVDLVNRVIIDILIILVIPAIFVSLIIFIFLAKHRDLIRSYQDHASLLLFLIFLFSFGHHPTIFHLLLS